MKIPSIKKCEAAVGPVHNWPGNCYAIASALVTARVIPGRAVYGHYYGLVSESSIFDETLPWQMHGWIKTPSGGIVDPTRWVFEDQEPYLYVSIFTTPEYDEGGEIVRTATREPWPDFNHADRPIRMVLSDALTECLRANFGTFRKRHNLIYSQQQLFWLANLPVTGLGKHARELYKALYEAGAYAFIPLDNRLRVEAENRELLDGTGCDGSPGCLHCHDLAEYAKDQHA